MIKQILLLGLLSVALGTAAQVTLSVQLPHGGMVQKDQLWNMVLVNNNNTIADAIISLDVQDAVTGQTVLSAVSRNFMLGKGVKVINIKDVQPLQYNYLAAELTGVYMPLGTYVACFRVIKNDNKTEPVGDECLRISITPLSPPLLNTPSDGATLETNYPQFTWLPPAPTDMFSSLSYDLLVTEILPGQSPTEAVLINTPLYTNYNLKTVYQNYPSTYSKLKAGQQYAWQVTARNGLNYAAQTEVWSFFIKTNDTAKIDIQSAGYVELKRIEEPSGIVTVHSEELLIKFYSFDKNHETIIRLLDAEGKQIKEIKQQVIYGNNYFRFKLNKNFAKNTIYKIEMLDERKQKYGANFTIL